MHPSRPLLQVVQEFLAHLSRVTTLAWSPDSQRVASGSIDTNIAVCSVTDGSTKVCKGEQSSRLVTTTTPRLHQMHCATFLIPLGAHPLSTVSAIVWVSDTKLLSAGHDICVRSWEV